MNHNDSYIMQQVLFDVFMIVNMLFMVKVYAINVYRVYKMGHGAVTWILKPKKKGDTSWDWMLFENRFCACVT